MDYPSLGMPSLLSGLAVALRAFQGLAERLPPIDQRGDLERAGASVAAVFRRRQAGHLLPGVHTGAWRGLQHDRTELQRFARSSASRPAGVHCRTWATWPTMWSRSTATCSRSCATVCRQAPKPHRRRRPRPRRRHRRRRRHRPLRWPRRGDALVPLPEPPEVPGASADPYAPARVRGNRAPRRPSPAEATLRLRASDTGQPLGLKSPLGGRCAPAPTTRRRACSGVCARSA